MTTALTLALAAATGCVAGCINAIAGGGSFLLLPILILLGGLDPAIANGTIRLGIIAQNVGAALTFRRRGVHEWPMVARLLAPCCLGALAGAWLATRLPSALLKSIFGIVLLAWAVLLALRPGRLTTAVDGHPKDATPVTYMLALLIAMYGGFIQAGVGFPLIGLLAYHLGYPLVRANAVKVAVVLGYTVIVLPVFMHAHQVAWLEGAALAIGMLTGGWGGVRLQLRGGTKVVRWVLLVMLAISGSAMILSAL